MRRHSDILPRSGRFILDMSSLILTLFSNPTILRTVSFISYCPCIPPRIPTTTEYSGRSHLQLLSRLFRFRYLTHQSCALAIIPHHVIRCLFWCRRSLPAFSCLIPMPAHLERSVPALSPPFPCACHTPPALTVSPPEIISVG